MTSEQIKAKFAELGADIPIEDIDKRLDDLTNRFKVPVKEAESSVVSFFLRKHGIERADYYKGGGSNEIVTVADIPHEDGKWLGLRVKVAQLWDSEHQSIDQVGLIGDETGTIKFVKWANANLPPLEEGKSYSIENIVTNLYNDRVSVTFNKTSKIEELDADIESRQTESEFTGAMVKITDGSGLIKRCKECKRALKSGVCSEHGSVDGTYDLRIMAVLDDGTSVQDILLNKEITELLWGHTLDESKAMAVDALEAGVVLDDMRTALVGKYYKVSGSNMDSMMLAKECAVV